MTIDWLNNRTGKQLNPNWIFAVGLVENLRILLAVELDDTSFPVGLDNASFSGWTGEFFLRLNWRILLAVELDDTIFAVGLDDTKFSGWTGLHQIFRLDWKNPGYHIPLTSINDNAEASYTRA